MSTTSNTDSRREPQHAALICTTCRNPRQAHRCTTCERIAAFALIPLDRFAGVL